MPLTLGDIAQTGILAKSILGSMPTATQYFKIIEGLVGATQENKRRRAFIVFTARHGRFAERIISRQNGTMPRTPGIPSLIYADIDRIRNGAAPAEIPWQSRDTLSRSVVPRVAAAR